MIARRLQSCLFAILIMLTGGAAGAEENHVTVAASLQHPAKAGAPDWLAVTLAIAPGWHIYWRNPGDTGLPTEATIDVPKGVTAGDAVWPTPQRFAADGIVNYGYSGTATLLMPLHVAFVAPGENATAHLSWLACAHMCVPERASLEIPLVQGPGAPPFGTWFAAMPKQFRGPTAARLEQRTLTLDLKGSFPVRASAIAFFPYATGLIDPDAKAVIRADGDGISMVLPRAMPLKRAVRIAGIVTTGQGAGLAVDVPLLDETAATAKPSATPPIGIALAVLFAFLGGLVLNLMPCVLPVLSMKALALAQAGTSARDLRRDGVAYFAGALATFLSIASVLIAFESAGAAVGWGFQLQSPVVIFALFLLTAGIGLNLIGVYEMPPALAGLGDGWTRGNNLRAAFFTGSLAALVASPCTAPFMGAALGFALTQPPAVALGIFAALGTGFALPFTALAFVPAIVRLIPKPGVWMVRFRECLAFPMFATAAWLLWVLDVQCGASGLALAMALSVGLLWLGWVLRHGGRILRGIAAGAAVALLFWGAIMLQPQARAAGADAGWQQWSPGAIAEAQHAGKPVLVDFTAAWCVTCLVNERVALDNSVVSARLRDDGVVLLKGDWTSRDSAITRELRAHGRDGVPLYLLYPGATGRAPIVLPQVLTPNDVLHALDSARPGPAAS